MSRIDSDCSDRGFDSGSQSSVRCSDPISDLRKYTVDGLRKCIVTGGQPTRQLEKEEYEINSLCDPSLGLSRVILSKLKTANYEELTPVQMCSMKLIAQGKDIMACAETGSGKTTAFLLPIINSLYYEAALPFPKVAHKTWQPR